jgi:hypothetical protein
MDYESITDENFPQTKDAEMIIQAERQENEQSSNSAAHTRCDWNYVYDEVV